MRRKLNWTALLIAGLTLFSVAAGGCASPEPVGNTKRSPGTTNTSAGQAGDANTNSGADTGSSDLSNSNTSVNTGEVGSGVGTARDASNTNSSQSKKAAEHSSGNLNANTATTKSVP